MSSSFITLKTIADHQDLIINLQSSELALQGTFKIPGDKSISHRALILGAISQGETIIKGLLLGQDPHNTAVCLRRMGVEIPPLNSDCITFKGVGLKNLQEPLNVLDAGNSGTTIRLMLGLLASHQGHFFCITGDNSLRTRPMSRVVKPLQEMGAKIWGRKNHSLAPLAIQGHNLTPIHYYSSIASAQVKSCILLAGLMTEGKTTITEPTLSRDHSERMLQAFGATLDIDPSTHSVTITGGTPLTGQKVVVPGDISSAAFWLVAGAIVPESELVIKNVGVNPTRTGILEVLAMMEANITFENQRVVTGEPVADLRVKSSRLKACTISEEIIPRLIDEIPILTVAAVFAQGITVIKDAAELRVKESDRLAAIASQLNRMGARITEFPDGLEIVGGTPLTGGELDSYADHRIAMSLVIAALMAKGPTIIHRSEAIAVSYPEFITTLQQLIT
ncbi:3-phosphoshikimate 1-carboxyvinyltransferase [Cyanobacterium sp. uoEpiScrs1]|uniref:3-phosphoshikimate 1-carboxyvinyltransferase n=1 Tax=Cyanobacterium sp. uoEpiScrs1 TaxID=2976343 RepID=UPI0022699432|nr:3-phosphoshikimate 1-carboxyvinyltransferase [Cyanobacterium sp. uoEpiScrs1]